MGPNVEQPARRRRHIDFLPGKSHQVLLANSLLLVSIAAGGSQLAASARNL
jgi:hypothetical protein